MDAITNIIKEAKTDLEKSLSNNTYETLETGFLKLILKTPIYIIGLNYTKNKTDNKKYFYISTIQTIRKDPEVLLKFRHHYKHLKIAEEYSKDLEIILKLNLYKKEIEQYNRHIKIVQEKIRMFKCDVNEFIKKKNYFTSKLEELEKLNKI